MIIKEWLRFIASNAISLIAVSFILTGFHVELDPMVVLIGSVVLSAAHYFLKPVLKAISFPINAFTFGFFKWVINVVLLYITVYFVDGITIEESRLAISPQQFNIDFTVPEFELNAILTLAVAALLINVINWILKKIIF